MFSSVNVCWLVGLLVCQQDYTELLSDLNESGMEEGF